MLNWIPDKIYLKMFFGVVMGQKLDLADPKSFSEKLQWLKLYYHKPEMTVMVDKFAVKEYISDKIGAEYVIPTIGVWDRFDDIDFETLPSKFVLKTTHDSGGIAVCRDKTAFDFRSTKNKIQRSLRRNYYKVHREWPYKNVKPRIIAEQYMEDAGKKDLTDYKFYCFNGEPKFLYVSSGLSDHSTAKINYVSLEWEKEPFRRTDYAEFDELPSKPVNFDKMVELSKILAKGIPFLRVDFYEINGKIYFGELTFFPGSGYTAFDPPEWDYIIGTWINLPQKNK